jgi:alpha-D-ribose 1-methylphosphonate 5-triphosphate synthase subunit PhnI
MTEPSYRAALDELRAAVDEYEAAVEALNRLAEERGQGDPALPLVVSESDAQLSAAVAREVNAKAAVVSATERCSRTRPQ